MTFTFKNPRIQYFSFPSNIISRLWKHPKSPTGILKLYQSCKYFYSKQKVAFFDEIIYSKGYQRSYDSAVVLKFPDNILFVSLNNMLIIAIEFPPFLINYFTMSRYYNITSLKLRNLNLKYEEFKILISITTIEEFWLLDSELCYSDNTPVTIDAVLAKLPNIECFRYQNVKDVYPLDALKKLVDVKLWNKLTSIHISMYDLSDTFNLMPLCKFIKNNLGPYGIVDFGLYITDEEKGKSLIQELKKMIDNWNDWDNKNPAPILGISGPW